MSSFRRSLTITSLIGLCAFLFWKKGSVTGDIEINRVSSVLPASKIPNIADTISQLPTATSEFSEHKKVGSSVQTGAAAPQVEDARRDVPGPVLKNYSISAFTSSGEINPEVYEVFGFTESEKQQFPNQWKVLLSNIKTVESFVVSDVVQERGKSSFTVGPIGPTTGPGLLSNVYKSLSASAPKSFVDYVLNYSKDDQNWQFYNNATGRKRFEITPSGDGGWAMTEWADTPLGENRWMQQAMRTQTFRTIPERYSKLIDPKP